MAAAKPDVSTDKVVIKKYANRRLYNTAKSSYVTLDDLAKMVRAGQDFTVKDAKSGEDITRTVLTQIIVEEEAKDQNMLPTNFLRQLIRLYGDPIQGLVPSYLEATMEAFQRNQDQMRSAFGSGSPMNNFESIARSNMEWFEKSMQMFSPFAGATSQDGTGSPAPAEEGGERNTAVDEDLDALRRQLRDVQTQLERMSGDRET